MKRRARTAAAALPKAWHTPSLSHGPHQEDEDGRDRHKSGPCAHCAAVGGGDGGGHYCGCRGKGFARPNKRALLAPVLSLPLLLLLYKPARDAKQATKDWSFCQGCVKWVGVGSVQCFFCMFTCRIASSPRPFSLTGPICPPRTLTNSPQQARLSDKDCLFERYVYVRMRGLA